MFLVLDTETHIDVPRVLRTLTPTFRNIADDTRRETDAECVRRVLQEMCELKKDTSDKACFDPARFHAPNTIVMLGVTDEMQYIGHILINDRKPDGSPDVKKIVQGFWKNYAYFKATQTYGPLRMTTFNGLRFDLPMLEVNGLEHGCDMSCHYNLGAKPWEDPRAPLGVDLHLDLYQYLSERSKLGGDLSYWSRLVGLPGKIDSNGGKVAEMLAKLDGTNEVTDYCICDVLNTYGLLFHVLRSMGRVATSYRGPIFEDVMAKMSAGRGTELVRFKQLYESDGLF